MSEIGTVGESTQWNEELPGQNFGDETYNGEIKYLKEHYSKG